MIIFSVRVVNWYKFRNKGGEKYISNFFYGYIYIWQKKCGIKINFLKKERDKKESKVNKV